MPQDASPGGLKPKTAGVLGQPLAVTDYAGAVELVQAAARRADQPYLVAAANTHVIALGRHDPEFGAALEKFSLLLPDGMPLVWCMNHFSGAEMKDRVYGPTFMLHCLEADKGEFSHYLVGGSEELLETLQRKLREKFSTIRIAGAYSPPFGPWPEDEDERIIGRIAQSGAQFVWIGLGCPKQEFWLARNKDRLPPGVYPAVGAAFAFHAGRVKQAPMWMQRLGLEWIFRLLAEPRRLWKRYVVYNSLFLFYLAIDFIKWNPGGRRS
jgi:N-acetylglucosaminyldiphosphoundecaprenol N-acetyl-beta-D-mannosaminyltransferase